jgi:hypothetical protein
MDNVITTIVAVVALIISVVSLIRTRMFNEQVLKIQQQNAEFTKLQRQKLEREEAERTACRVTAFWYIGTNNSEHINIVNSGGIDAFNINLRFHPREGRESPEIEQVMQETFPIPKLRPGEERNFLVAPSMGSARPWPITISWANSEEREYSIDLVLS